MSAGPPFFSVLIVNYNAGEYLERCLKALRAQSFDAFEAIIVDNNSQDNSLFHCHEHLSDPRIQLIRMPHNVGFAAGNNRGASVSRGEWLVTLNPDAFPSPDWLSELSAATQKYSAADMFGSTQINARSPTELDGVGDAYLAIGIPWRGGMGHPVETAPQDYETFAPCAAAAAYRASSFRQVKGFDEDFFCYVEDVDLAFRLRLMGSKCIQLKNAQVYHIGGATSDAAGSFARYHGIRNLIWVFVKNMPAAIFWLMLPLHVLALLVLFVKAVHRGNASVTSKAILDGVRGLPPVWLQRRKIQAVRRASTADVASALCWNPKTYFQRDAYVIRPSAKAPTRS